MIDTANKIADRAIEAAREAGITNPRLERTSENEWRFHSESSTTYAVLVEVEGRLLVGLATTQPRLDPIPGRPYDLAGTVAVAHAIVERMKWQYLP